MLETENTVMETGSITDDFKKCMDENTTRPGEKTESTDDNTPSSSSISTTESKTNPGILKEPSKFPRSKHKKKVRFTDMIDTEGVIVNDRLPEMSGAVRSYLYDHKNIVSKYHKCTRNLAVVKPSSKYSIRTDVKFKLFEKQELVENLWKREDSIQSQIFQQLTPAMEPNETNSLGFDYKYQQLLSRCYRKAKKCASNSTKSKHTTKPSVCRNVPQKIILPPPKISILSQKTIFSNINCICTVFLAGVLKHMALGILSELEASGYVDSDHQLVICRSVNQQQIESAVRRYLKKYARCSSCKSFNTLMREHSRRYVQICKNCKAECSISKTESRPQAAPTTSKRETMKRKIVSSLIFILLYLPYFYLYVLPLHHLFVYNKIWIPFLGVITF